MDAKQRKLLNTLSISGMALIAFCLLDVVKIVLYWFCNTTQFEIIEMVLAELNVDFWQFVLVLIVFLVVELALSLFIGLSARSEGKGKKRNIFYIIVACLMAICLAVSGIFTVVYCFLGEINVWSILDSFISAMVDFTVIFVLLQIIISSLKLRKQKDKGGQE